MSRRTSRYSVNEIAVAGMMTALVLVVNYIHIPFLGSKLTPANALCVLSGLLLGPQMGFITAGLGSFLYDIFVGYAAESLITLLGKGLIGLLAGVIAGHLGSRKTLTDGEQARVIVAGIVGSLAYVALYMFKSYVFYGVGKMIEKFPASFINAAFAMIIAPVMYSALRIPLRPYLPSARKS